MKLVQNMNAENILTIGVDYRIVRGGVAAVENVYSTFYKPFNHVTTVVDGGQVKKLFILCRAFFQFFGWMLFRPQIEIVHVHGASNASFWRKRIFIYIAKSFGKKIVYHMHGGGFETFTHKHEYAVRKLVSRCDAIIALSDYWKFFFEKELGCNHVEIIKNVISAPQNSHHSTTNRFTLLFLGLLGQNKGIYDLLSVIADNKDIFNGKLRLCIGGNGEVEKVKNLIKSYGISDMVEYEGWVSGDKKTDLLNYADAYILPSYKEGLPISILEAMSYALPIISTPVGGIPEIVKDGVNGYLVTPGNKEEIGQAIKLLMDNVEKRREMGWVSQHLVKEHLPIYVEKQLCELYKSILTSKNS